MEKCNTNMEVYTRVVGFYRPVENFHEGAKAAFFDRTEYEVKNSVLNKKDKIK